MKATRISFERRYSDDSGVEFAVELIRGNVRFTHVDDCEFPAEEIDWLIECLKRVKEELPND